MLVFDFAAPSRLEEWQGKLGDLAKAVEKATEEHGENSKEVEKAKTAYANQAIEVAKLEQKYNSAQGDVNKFTREIDENEAALRDVQRGYNDAGKKLDEYGREIDDVNSKTKRFGSESSSAIGDIVTSLGLMKVASAIFNEIKQAIGGAVERYDTLSKFPKVMEQMGIPRGAATSKKKRKKKKLPAICTDNKDNVAAYFQEVFKHCPDAMTTTEIAQITGLHNVTIRKMITTGKLKAVSQYNAYFIPKQYFLDFVATPAFFLCKGKSKVFHDLIANYTLWVKKRTRQIAPLPPI